MAVTLPRPANRVGRPDGTTAPPMRPLRGMFTGNDPATLDAWINEQGVDIPLGHQFLHRASWPDLTDPYMIGLWADWVAAKPGRRYSCSLATATQADKDAENPVPTAENPNPVPADPSKKYLDVINGAHDADFKKIADTLHARAATRNAIIRLGWEFNEPGHPYSIRAGNADDLANYKASFTRACQVLKANAPEVIIEWCPNVGDTAGWSFEEMYPTAADDYIDVIGVGCYDYMWGAASATPTPFIERWNWIVTGLGYDGSGPGRNGLADQVKLARRHGKWVAHTEWGLWPYDPANPNGTTGTDPRFIRKLARWHRTHGYVYEIYNNVLVNPGTSDEHDHRLASYPDSLAAYKEIHATSSPWLPADTA